VDGDGEGTLLRRKFCVRGDMGKVELHYIVPKLSCLLYNGFSFRQLVRNIGEARTGRNIKG